ncbi:Gfo/Idh/MocA family oxidoreductase [Microvirga sp. BT689]|uniref:Gfo/Idh/MocA family protein n=1 Tax=Microvirga arvi TaxID=2778731 RepID=UPI00194F1266|nr:Gfo/Idh/MocA family oxidoreductase [Microvirga arvi]MBM6581899.1 Gfo/Idh/MocA family oxidoreductase [Microvirga arvi]
MRVAVIGASFAKAAYLPALAHTPGAEIVALASARLASARTTAEAFNVPHAYDDWKAMLQEHQVDLVCIATPTVTHAPMALAALEAGANVLCEKPTAMNAGEAKTMLDRAVALERVHMIDHELRFNPNRRKIKSLIESGYIGRVRHAHITNIGPSWATPDTRPKGDWWSMKDQGGGRLGANGSHQTDLLRWWFGEPRSVVGQALTMVPERVDKATGEPWIATADDTTHFTVEMESGAVVSVFLSGVARHAMDNVTQIYGSEGTILLNNSDEKLMVARAGEPFQDMTETDPNAALPGLNKGIWNVSVVGVMRELAAAIAEGRQPREGATFYDGWRNQLVLDAVLESHRDRRWIDISA